MGMISPSETYVPPACTKTRTLAAYSGATRLLSTTDHQTQSQAFLQLTSAERVVVVRGGVEPPTFRFSGVLSSLRPLTRTHTPAQLTGVEAGQWACMAMVPTVPPCAA